jgi:ribonuclease HI
MFKQRWNNFTDQLEGVRKLAVPRWLTGMNEDSNITLHVFCDASVAAYGAIAYVVCDNNPYVFSPAMAKSRIVPKSANNWTIPRKELAGVMEGARIATIVNRAILGRAKELIVWTDSTTVLKWITNQALRPIRYVRRRLDKLDLLYHRFSRIEYRHVATHLNPADIASRGLNLTKDKKERFDLWLEGPTSLLHNDEDLESSEDEDMNSAQIFYLEDRTMETTYNYEGTYKRIIIKPDPISEEDREDEYQILCESQESQLDSSPDTIQEEVTLSPEAIPFFPKSVRMPERDAETVKTSDTENITFVTMEAYKQVIEVRKRSGGEDLIEQVADAYRQMINKLKVAREGDASWITEMNNIIDTLQSGEC